ncbi:MAG: hypothetical protein ABIP79_07960 [Chitinophagaceae bacterium]
MKTTTDISCIIPENITGKALDLEDSITENTIEDACKTFKRATTRLLNPPVWHQLGGSLSASFELASIAENHSTERLAKRGDYLRIDIPGPSSSVGDNFDWVKVDAIYETGTEQEDEQNFGIKLMVSANPDKLAEGVAHFFKEGASSTFIIQRTGTKVKAFYHGRNERTNDKTGNFTDKIRNAIIAGSAIAVLSNMQWKSFIRNLLQKEIGG